MTPIFDTLPHLNTPNPTIKIHHPNDHQQATQFLYSYRGSPDTYATYRRELERYYQWLWHHTKKDLKNITRHDIETYIEFCQNPPIDWIGTENVPKFQDQAGTRIPNQDWRPFVAKISKTARKNHQIPNRKNYTLSQKAIQSIFSVLSSYHNYLIQEDYLTTNPISQIRQKSKYIRKQQTTTAPIRRLTELQWNYVIETAEMMADTDPNQHERTLFIMNILYSLYLRISELVTTQRWQPKMSDFHRDNDDNWWLTTVGKGNKQRTIAISDTMLDAIKRYRLHLNLTSLPTPGELEPLICKTKGNGGIKSTRQIRNIVQTCFDAAVERMEEENFQEESQSLQAATVHWLRHTGISDDVKHRPREHVRDDAGHGSSAITDKYIDIELKERHRSARKKTIKP